MSAKLTAPGRRWPRRLALVVRTPRRAVVRAVGRRRARAGAADPNIESSDASTAPRAGVRVGITAAPEHRVLGPTDAGAAEAPTTEHRVLGRARDLDVVFYRRIAVVRRPPSGRRRATARATRAARACAAARAATPTRRTRRRRTPADLLRPPRRRPTRSRSPRPAVRVVERRRARPRAWRPSRPAAASTTTSLVKGPVSAPAVPRARGARRAAESWTALLVSRRRPAVSTASPAQNLVRVHAFITQADIRSQDTQHARQADGREVVDDEPQRLLAVRRVDTSLRSMPVHRERARPWPRRCRPAVEL